MSEECGQQDLFEDDLEDDLDQRRKKMVCRRILAGEEDLIFIFNWYSEAITSWMEYQDFWVHDNTGEKIALMHSELSEALEADRKALQSDHIPDFLGIEEELADTIIRIFDFAGYHKLRLGEALIAKMLFNLKRERKHGKSY